MRILNVFVLGLLVSTQTQAQNFEDGKKAIENENYLKARNILLPLAQGGADKKASYYLANAYLKLEEIDSAKMYYKFLGPELKNAYGHLANARLAVLNGDKVAAKKLLNDAAVASKMKDAEVLYQAGDALYKPTATDLQLAITYFEDAYKLDVKHSANMLELGDAYLENNEGGKAMSKYESAADVNRTLAMPHIKIGRLSSNGKMYPEAVTAYEKAVSIEPNNAIAHWELGEAYYRTKQYDKAKNEFKKYTELNKEDVNAGNKYIQLLYQLKEYDEVIAEGTKMLNSDPKNFYVLRALMYANYELKRYKEGNSFVKNFWDLSAGKKINSLDYITSARLASQVGDTVVAFKYFSSAIAAEPKNADLASEYAKALWNAKKYSDAAAAYTSKINNLGGTSLDYFYQGRCYFYLKNYLAADSSFAKFAEKNPESPDGHKWRAKSLSQLDPDMKAALAKPHYERFIEVAKKDAGKNKKDLIEAYDYLGAHAYSIKDLEGAKANFNNTLSLDPADQYAVEMMKSIK